MAAMVHGRVVVAAWGVLALVIAFNGALAAGYSVADFDVVVYGATPSGVMAAVSAGTLRWHVVSHTCVFVQGTAL